MFYSMQCKETQINKNRYWFLLDLSFFLFTKYKMIGKKINILLKRYLYSNSLYLLFNQK